MDKPGLHTIITMAQPNRRGSVTSKRSINRLPNEILYDVFDFCVPFKFAFDPEEEYQPRSQGEFKTYLTTVPPRNISAVCQRWRRIVEDGEGLWARFYVRFNTWPLAKNPQEDLRAIRIFISEHLNKSGTALLRFGVQLFDSARWINMDFMTGIVTALSEHQHRWQDVLVASSRLVLSVPEDSRLRGLLPERWERLESIRLHLGCSFDLRDFQEHLRLLPTLTSLSLEFAHFSVVISLLRASVNLQEFTVSNPPLHDDDDDDNDDDDDDDDLSAFYSDSIHSGMAIGQNLQRLNVSADYFALLEHMQCPQLAELTASRGNDGTDHWLLQVFIDFLQRSEPRLQSLCLDIWPDNDFFEKCLRLAPSLATLTISGCLCERTTLVVVLMNTNFSNHGISLNVVPHLEKLVLRDCEIRLDSLARLIERRCANLATNGPDDQANQRGEGLKSVEVIDCRVAD